MKTIVAALSMWWRCGLLILTILLAGCTGPAGPEDLTPEAEEGPLPPAVVVADVSGGVNPYHEVFHRPDWTHHPSERIRGLSPDVPALDLTLDVADHETGVAVDADAWAGYQEGQVHWIPGTNLLLYTDTPYDDPERPSGAQMNAHGTATAAAVSVACPDCYVLVIQDAVSLDGSALRLMTENMSWVDLAVSTSPFGQGYVPPTGMPPFREAMREFHESGRLYFTYTGNFIATGVTGSVFGVAAGYTPFLFPDISYPPWAVMVGGAHSSCGASELHAGKPAEFVGDFTQDLPYGGATNETVAVSGVSFATPQVAGLFGRALLEVRTAYGHEAPGDALWTSSENTTLPSDGPLADGVLTQEELRHAFTRDARWFAPTDYDPMCPRGIHPLPVSPTPWVEMGWGHLGDDEADAVAKRLVDGTAGPDRPAEAELYMQLLMCARYPAVSWLSIECL